MDLMGEGARLLNTRQIHEQRGATGDIDMSTSGTDPVAASTPGTASGVMPVIVSALLPAPRPSDALPARSEPAEVLPELPEFNDEDALTLSEEAEIEARHRRAAELGDPSAMTALGTLLLRRGDLDGAEPYLRAAVGHGERAAANNLGLLLHQRGHTDEAAEWWGIAAAAGSAPAAHALGRHYRERGDEPAAEYWLRQAA